MQNCFAKVINFSECQHIASIFFVKSCTESKILSNFAIGNYLL